MKTDHIREKDHKKQWITFRVVLFCILLSQAGIHACAQVMVNATGKPASLVICGSDGMFTLQIANTTGGTMTGSVLSIDLPAGVRYSPGSVIGATEFNISNLNQPVFTLPDILNNTAHNVSYNASLICGYTNTENFIYTVTYNSTNYTGFDTPLQNYYYPEPVITNITNASAVIPVNTTVTRDITIQQQGTNSNMDTLWLLDSHTADIQIISTSIGTLHPYIGPGPIRVDTIIITGSDFPGGNGLFDAGETIIVSETVKLVGCTNGQSTLKASWGCYGQICNFYSAFPTVSPAAGTTSIAMAYTNNNLGWGFIDNHGWVEYNITNNGTGAGTAFNLVTLAGFSSGGSTYYPNSNWINKIDSFSVNGIKIPAIYNYAAGALNGQYAFYTHFLYTSDPDGAGIGLDDADGDGFFDDLPIGKTVKVKAHCYYSWTQAQSSIPIRNTCGYGWTNSAYQSFRYGYDYKNQCLVQSGVNWIPNGNLLLFQTYDTRTSKHTMPPDLFDNIPVWMEHEVVTATSVTVEGCPNDSVIYIIILPKGLTIAAGTATFKGVSIGTPLIIGDTVFYFLDRSRILTGGLFRVPLKLDCVLRPPLTGYVMAGLKFWCDHTLYPNRYFTYWCSNSPVFWMQCPPPDCKEPSISLLNVKRTTLGWTNNQLTSKVNPATPGLRLENAMSRDTIRIEAAGKLNGPTDSLFFKLMHDAPGGSWGNQLFFEPLLDTLFFFDYETSTWYTCPGLSQQVTNGTTSTLTTYFGNLPTPGNCLNGITYSLHDSIRYVLYGRVKNIAQTEWRTVPSFRSYFYLKKANKENYCTSRGATFNILGSNYPSIATTFYQQIVLQGCNSFLYEGIYYRSIEACGGDGGFPNEIRPYSVIDTMFFLLPEGFVYQPGSSNHYYFKDNGSTQAELIADPIIDVSAAGTKLIYIRMPSWSYSDYIDCWNTYDRITFYATPSCKATGDYSYSMDARGRYQFMADGAGVRATSTASKSISYTPPLMTLTRLITTAEGREDTVMWKIRLCNTRSFTANNNWVGFESSSGGIQITDITDITNPAAPINIPIASYGPGKTWATMGAFSANLCKIYRVRAVYTSCYYDSLFVRHGYNCASTPLNPELGYPPSGYLCNENSTFIYLDPKDVSLNLSVTSPANPVNLCDTIDYEVLVTNSQPATAYNLQLSIFLPPGTGIMTGQSKFKYPYTTGSYLSISDPVNFPAGSNKWVYNISVDPNAVVKLKGVDSIPQNGYRLKFRILNDCYFISGTQLKVIAAATNACGDEKTRASFTQPILITGLPTNVNLYVLNTTTGAGFQTCNTNSIVKVKIINLGPSSVSSIEKLSVSIDDAFDYVNNSLTGIHNGPSGVASNSVTGGVRYIYFAIQPNLTVNDSIVFTFRLYDIDPGSLVCDTIQMETSTLLVGEVFCSLVPGDSCIIQSITASITTEKPVLKDHVEFGYYSASSVPNGITGETVTISYSVKNMGTDTLRSSDLNIVFIHDANGNGLPDETSADSLFSQSVSTLNILPGDSVITGATFVVPSAKICSMLAVMHLAGNPCTCNGDILEIPNIRLFNAGQDVSVCQGTDIQIGTPGISGYTYIWVPSSFLNSGTISDPAFNYNSLLTNPITLPYSLITTRQGNCITKDTVLVTVTPQTSAFAGNDDTICQGMLYTISDAQAQYHSSVLWQSSGNGTFNDSTLLNPVYSPSLTDVLAGYVNLTLMATGGCGVAMDAMKLTLIPAATSYAGKDTSICSPWTYSLLDGSATNYSMIRWKTMGDGVFNDTTLLHPIYNPGPLDISTGFVKLILTATGNSPCPTVKDTMKLVLNPVPIVTNSSSALMICSGDTTHIGLTANLPGTVFIWTCIPSSPSLSGFSSGAGDSINQTIINAGFTIETVTYSIIPSANGCTGPAFDFIVTVNPKPDLSNNPLSSQICSGSSANVILTSNVGGADFTWTASCNPAGSVTGFTNPQVTGVNVISDILTNTTYNPATVTYHITPLINGCEGTLTDYTVTVYPKPDLSNPVLTASICDSTFVTIPLFSNIGNTTLTWRAFASSTNLSGYSSQLNGIILLNQRIDNSGYTTETVTYRILPIANNCPGDSTDIIVTVYPTPDLSNPVLTDSICDSTYATKPLTSNVTGTLFTWRAFASSANLTGYSNQATGTTLINQMIDNTGYATETLTYRILSFANACNGDSTDVIFTVFPTPDLANTDRTDSICDSVFTNITLTSNVTGTLFTWRAFGSSPQVTGYSNSIAPGTSVSQQLENNSFIPLTVTYRLLPAANGCMGDSIDYVVSVFPRPDLNNAILAKEICNNNNTNITLTSNVSGTLFTWTATSSSVSVTGFTNSTTPTTLINQNLINTGDTPETVTYHITPHANGCDGWVYHYVVTVIPSPYLTNSPLRQPQCNNQNTNLTLTSNVAGTQFSWTATSSSPNLTGYSNSVAPGTIISQTLTNSGYNVDSVTYHITPNTTGCSGSTTDYNVIVFPVPDVYFIPNGQVVCEGETSSISMQSHVLGTTYSWTATASSPNLSGYSNSSGNIIAQTISNSGTTNEIVTYQVTPEANGCPPGIVQNVILTVKPRPAISNTITTFQLCSGSMTAIFLQANLPGSTFAWRAFGSSSNVAGYLSGTGTGITQSLTNSGFTNEWVTYRVAATTVGCTGDSTDFTVTVFPLPDVYFTPSGQTICPFQTTNITNNSHVSGATFTWTAGGSSLLVSGYSAGSGDLIQQTLNNTGYNIETVTYQVSPKANGCPGTVNNVVVMVDPAPFVSLRPCIDTITMTDAQPIHLKGGEPLGGIYTGTGVDSVTGIFYPNLAGAGTHKITYKYTNYKTCTSYDTIFIINYPLSIINCGSPFTDIRDNQVYPTVQIGPQCWFAINLNYGKRVPSAENQRDNCTPEKYCYNDNQANCANYGGYYQWDEIMQYRETPAIQGICPPGWHIPTEADWNTLFSAFINNGFAGSALKYSGYSGFNAFLYGTKFFNKSWNFLDFATYFWSSAPYGTFKAWAHAMNEFDPSVSAYPSSRSNAFSVRCVLD